MVKTIDLSPIDTPALFIKNLKGVVIAQSAYVDSFIHDWEKDFNDQDTRSLHKKFLDNTTRNMSEHMLDESLGYLGLRTENWSERKEAIDIIIEETKHFKDDQNFMDRLFLVHYQNLEFNHNLITAFHELKDTFMENQASLFTKKKQDFAEKISLYNLGFVSYGL